MRAEQGNNGKHLGNETIKEWNNKAQVKTNDKRQEGSTHKEWGAETCIGDG